MKARTPENKRSNQTEKAKSTNLHINTDLGGNHPQNDLSARNDVMPGHIMSITYYWKDIDVAVNQGMISVMDY